MTFCAIAAFFVACNSDKGSSSQEELDLVMEDDEHHSGMKLLWTAPVCTN